MGDIEKFTKAAVGERPTIAEAILQDAPATEEELEAYLAELREGRVPEGAERRLPAVAYHPAYPGELRATALLGLYYLVDIRGEEADAEAEETTEAGKRLLDELVTTAAEEPDEHLRGRMYWVRIRRLREEHAEPEAVIETVVEALRHAAGSSYVEGRVAAALGGWDGIHALLPPDGSWDVPDTSEWSRVRASALQDLRRSAGQIAGLRARIPELLMAVAGGRIDSSELAHCVEALPADLRAYMIPAPLLGEMLETLDALGRNALLAAVTTAATQDDLPRLSAYAEVFDRVAGESDDWVDRFTRLSLAAALANLAGRHGASEPTARTAAAGDAPRSAADVIELAAPALELLARPLPAAFDAAPVRHSASRLAGAVLRMAASTADLGQHTAASVFSPQAVAALLEHESPYMAVVGADLCLILARRGLLPAELIGPLRAALAAHPDSENEMCSGRDLDADDFVIPDGVGRIQAPGTEDEDDGFSLSTLTSLLEACREPAFSWRVGAALSVSAAGTDQSELRDWLEQFAERNGGVRAGLETPVAQSEPAAVPGPVHPDFIGPCTLSELETLLAEFAGLDEGRRHEWQAQTARVHGEELAIRLRDDRRAAIRSVFEGGTAPERPFVHVIAELTHRGFVPGPPRAGIVPGRDGVDDESMDVVPSTERLAYYVAARCLDADRRHQWGVYVRARPLARLLRALGVPRESVLEPVLVHELLHHHVAVRAAELGLELPCGGFRRFEEAAADWNGVRHLDAMHEGGRIDAATRNAVRPVVFPTLATGGVRGYGEWDRMDADSAAFAPFVSAGGSMFSGLPPERYAGSRPLLVERSGARLATERRLWQSLLGALAGAEVPLYLDCS